MNSSMTFWQHGRRIFIPSAFCERRADSVRGAGEELEVRVAGDTVNIGVLAHPLGWLSRLHCAATKRVPTPKRVVFERFRRELSLDVSVGVHILLVMEQSSLRKVSLGGVPRFRYLLRTIFWCSVCKGREECACGFCRQTRFDCFSGKLDVIAWELECWVVRKYSIFTDILHTFHNPNHTSGSGFRTWNT